LGSLARFVRWLLIVPAAVATWYAALVLGMSLHLGLDALCPADQVVSGRCVAPWYQAASAVVSCIGAGLAALLILLSCTLLAPTHRRLVAIATFIAGAVVASFMGFSAGAFGPMVTAIVTGAVVLWVLLRQLTPLALPNISLERTRGG
jgi:hypothetical protein